MELTEITPANCLESSSCDYWLDSPSPHSSLATPFLYGSQPLSKDLWSFDFFWTEVKRKFSSIEDLYNAITDLKNEIERIKEKYRKLIALFPELIFEKNGERGVSGSYFLSDDEGNRRYVVKPLDEDAGCIHNEGYATPFIDSPLRANIPLYRGALREVLAYQVALILGVGSIVPKTELGIFTSPLFHDFSEGIDPDERPHYLEKCGLADLEKLCSVQEYVPDSKSLFEALQEFQVAGLSDEEIEQRIDFRDFEEANILIWTTYDTDGHSGNFLVYPKGVDEIGNEILGIKKIDNSLAFPDKNQQLRNNLSYLPHANKTLSEEAKAKIRAVNVEALIQQFELMGLESAVPALVERIKKLKELAETPEITIKEINKAMSKMGKKV